MRAPPERSMRDLYDRTRHKDLAAPEEQAEVRGGGRAEGSGHRGVVARMEDKATIRRRLVSSDNSRVKAESGTCNVCYAPCSSCLHRSLELVDTNVDCGSSQTCSTRSEIKNISLIRSEKGLRNRGGENDDEFSAASSNASYSETGGNKVVARSSVAEDYSEVDMPAKCRRLSNQDTRLSRAEYHDDSNSCVTESKLLPEKKKLSTSASSRDLTIKDFQDNSIASRSSLRNQCADESTEKKGSDFNDIHPSSSGRLFPADTASAMTRKLLRTQSSVSASKGLCPKKQAHESGKAQDSLSRQPCDKAFPSNNFREQTSGGKSNPCVVGGDNHGMLTGCSLSNRNKNKVGKCSNDEIQEHTDIQSIDDAKRNRGDKEDWEQDCSMDISNDRKLNLQNDVMTDCGNSEGLIDVNVCDICGDVGREYLLATCTRCLEGAEHTYCMRVKLDKVPDGEWLCEECQLKDDLSKTRCKYNDMTVTTSEGKKQSSEIRSKPKALQVVVPNLDASQLSSTPTADQCDDKNQKSHLALVDTQPRQVKVTTPATERLDVKNKKLLSMANCKKLQVVTSDLEARPHTNGTPTPGSSDKKNQSSEFWLNHQKLRVSTDMESPLSSVGLRSPPISCKRQAENALSPKPRLFKMDSLRKHEVFSRESSFKKPNNGTLTSLDNAPLRTQAVKSSQTLSRSYSMGSMVNVKAPVPSPRGPLSKQLSFNNNGPKVKPLAEGMASKLRPVKHSPRDPRDKGPIKKFMKSGSLKCEGSICKDAGSSKQKQSSQDEKPGLLKPMKEKNLIERRDSFSFKKPNIPSSPRPDSSMKSGKRKLEQDISRSGPSMLKSSKKTGNVEKKQSSDLSKSDKQDATVHQKPTGFVSGKDAYTVKISDPPVPSQCVEKDDSNDGHEDSSVLVKDGNRMPTEPPEVPPTTLAALTGESDLQDIVPRVSASEDVSKDVCSQQKPLESTVNDSCNIIVEAAQTSEDILPQNSHGLLVAHNLYPTDNKLDLKQEPFADESLTLENLSRDIVIPEQSYIWQGSFEVSRRGNSPETFNGIQAYLSTCASSKVREIGKQLPHKIQLAEVPRHSSWPLKFKEVNPTEDNIALFFFAKDVESYENAYGKLLENMLLGDLSLTANVGGAELLIFPSDKLPERTQCWNGLLFFWGIFYARKTISSQELPVTGTNNCPSEPVTKPVIQHDVCSPKVVQSLGIDLNECPHDDLSDLPVSLGSVMESSVMDHTILLESKHEDREMNACQETSGTGQIVLGRPTAASCGTHLPMISAGEDCDMTQDYPIAAKGTTGTTGRGNMGEESGFRQGKTLFFVAQQAGAVRPVPDEMMARKLALLPSVNVSSQYFSGSKISDDPCELIPKSDMGSLDSDSSCKMQKISDGKHSTCSFGDEVPSKCLSKIHPLPGGQHNPFDTVQYVCRGPSGPGSLTKPIPDHVIHVLSSDDEDTPEPSSCLSKASLKADEGSSPLLSLSLSTVATKHNLAESDIREDEPLSLSLGLPGVVEGSQTLEMKQFLPEKPGINT